MEDTIIKVRYFFLNSLTYKQICKTLKKIGTNVVFVNGKVDPW